MDLGDVTLCVESFGDPDAPTLLLLSGAAESMDGWEPAWCRELAAGGRRVVRYDHRETGRSTASPPGRPAYPGTELGSTPSASSTRSAWLAPTWSGCRWAAGSPRSWRPTTPSGWPP